jgi:hypothetical protein
VHGRRFHLTLPSYNSIADLPRATGREPRWLPANDLAMKQREKCVPGGLLPYRGGKESGKSRMGTGGGRQNWVRFVSTRSFIWPSYGEARGFPRKLGSFRFYAFASFVGQALERLGDSPEIGFVSSTSVGSSGAGQKVRPTTEQCDNLKVPSLFPWEGSLRLSISRLLARDQCSA